MEVLSKRKRRLDSLEAAQGAPRDPGRAREGRDLGVAFQAPPGSQASSRGEAKDSALLSSRDAKRSEVMNLDLYDV